MKRIVLNLLICLLPVLSLKAQQKHYYFSQDAKGSFGTNLIELDQNSGSKVLISDTVLNKTGKVFTVKELNANKLIGLSGENYYFPMGVFEVSQNSGEAEVIMGFSGDFNLGQVYVIDTNKVLGINKSKIFELDIQQRNYKQILDFDSIGFSNSNGLIFNESKSAFYAFCASISTQKTAYLIKYDLLTQQHVILDSITSSDEFKSYTSIGLDGDTGLVIVKESRADYKKSAFFYYSLNSNSSKELYRISNSQNYYRQNAQQIMVQNHIVYGCLRGINPGSVIYHLNLHDTSEFGTDTIKATPVLKETLLQVYPDSTYKFASLGALVSFDLLSKQTQIITPLTNRTGLGVEHVDYNRTTNNWLFLCARLSVSGFENNCLLLDSSGDELGLYRLNQSRFGLTLTDRLLQFSKDKLMFCSVYAGENNHGVIYEFDLNSKQLNVLHTFGNETQNDTAIYQGSISSSLLKLKDSLVFIAFNSHRIGIFNLNQKKIIQSIHLKGKIKDRPFLFQDKIYAWFEDSLNFTRHILYEYNTTSNSLRRLASDQEIQTATGCYSPGKSVVRIGDFVYAGQFCSAFFGGSESTGFAKIDVNMLAISHQGASIQKNGISVAEGAVITDDGRIALMSESDLSEGYGKLILFSASDGSFESFQQPGFLLGYKVDGPMNYSRIDNALYFFCKNAAKPSDSLQGIILKFDIRNKAFYKVGEYDKTTFKQSELLSLSPFPNSIGPKSHDEILIYPNPSSDFWKIQWPGKAQVSWILYDIQGKQVLNGQGNEVKSWDLKPGIFILQVTDGMRTKSVKVQKNH